MVRTELRKANNDIFFEAERSADNSCILANWVGLQSLESIVMGGNLLLSMLREKPCSGILNSNRELVGPWSAGVNWIALKWAPQAKVLGVQYYAHVLSHGIYGQKSYQELAPLLSKTLEIRSFEEDELAQDWLRTKFEGMQSSGITGKSFQ